MIVGAGECGARAAFALRENGYGGPVTLLGQENLAPYERPPLSKPRSNGTVPVKEIASQSQWDIAEISLRLNSTVINVDRANSEICLTDGNTLGYDRLLLATGARARKLPLAMTNPVACLRTVSDAQHISDVAVAGAHVAIIGAGLIGLELAAQLRNEDVEVTVIEATSAALGRTVAPPLADVLVQRHKAEGVKFIFCAQVTAIENRKITLKNGSEITADLVVAAIGAVPETDLAERSGLVVQNGIVVNAELETSDKSIFAAGDCCNFPSSHTGDKIRLESWRNAVEQGVHAAANMLGAAKEYKKTPWFWSDQYDLTLQAAGVSQPGQTYLRRELETKAVILFQLGQDGKLFSASGLGPTGSVAKEIRIAELMMERGIQPDPSALVDAQINLKTLLRSS